MRPVATIRPCPGMSRGTESWVPMVPGFDSVTVVPAKSSGDSLLARTFRMTSSYAAQNPAKSSWSARRMFGTRRVLERRGRPGFGFGRATVCLAGRCPSVTRGFGAELGAESLEELPPGRADGIGILPIAPVEFVDQPHVRAERRGIHVFVLRHRQFSSSR